MLQITYTSEATSALRSGDVFRIVTTSSTRNNKAGLTGFLIYSGSRFFQLLEGPEETVDALLSRLERDPRHTNITVTSRRTILERSFPRWNMKRLSEALSPIALIHHVPEMDQAPPEVRAAVVDFLSDASIPAEQPLNRMHG